jgi:uncharacterized protein
VKSDLTAIGRHAERGHYDFPTLAAIFDEALICHVGFIVDDATPIVLPTIHTRIDRALYLHGSVLARWLKNAVGNKLCISATIVDAVVLARSAFNHSMNYRSAVAVGTAAVVESVDERATVLERLVEHVCPGRWRDARWPTETELAATTIVKVPIEEGSAKIRSGPPVDRQSDMTLDVWAGLLPVHLARGEPVADPQLSRGISAPPYLFQKR